MTPTIPSAALLTSVPLEHLIDGRDVCSAEGKVAFGSRAWQVFRDLDAIRKGEPVNVYIYASHADDPFTFEATWQASYTGHVESIGGAHPAGMRYRPPSTRQYANDNDGFWAVFWAVELLRELPPKDRIRIEKFCGLGKRRGFTRGFVPEGPLLVECPT